MVGSLKNLINYCLRFDPKTTHYTKKLEGCCVLITLKSTPGISIPGIAHLDRHYRITFCREGLETLEQLDPTPSFPRKRESSLDPRFRGDDDVEGDRINAARTASIAATPLTFASLLLHKNSSDLMQDLIMEGDPEILVCLEQWLYDCQIDWAEIMAGFLGDSAAHGFDSMLHRLKIAGRQKLNDLSASMGEYAVEEGLFAPSVLINPFLEAVDKLRARIDRLEAKL